MRFSRTNMRLAAARLPDLSREIDAQAAEFSITHFCPRNPGLTKSTTYARETAKIGRSLFKSSLKIAEQNPHLYRRDAEAVVDAILDTITVALARGNRVELRVFG